MELKPLFDVNNAQARNFKANIRQYNSAFAFASFGAQLSEPPGHGPYCFRIHGQIYHRAGTLHPTEGQPHQFAQLYILEASQAIENRLIAKRNTGCRDDTMHLIQQTLDTNSPYAAAFRHMHQVE